MNRLLGVVFRFLTWLRAAWRRFERRAGLYLVSGADRSVGCIDGADGHSLNGWFIARYRGAESNRFVLSLDDLELGRFDAAAIREDLAAIEGVLRCGFSVDMRAATRNLPAASLAPREGVLRRLILSSERGREVAELQILGLSPGGFVQLLNKKPSKIQELLAGGCVGYLDRADDVGLAGWAIDPARPDVPVDLIILVDGVEFLRIKTSSRRGDLVKKGMAGEAAGFRLSWPSGLFPAGTQVDVQFASSRVSLARSPRKLSGGDRPASTLGYYLNAVRAGLIPPTTVIVPIYNAYDAVVVALQALIRNTRDDVQILLLDDCSTDPRIGELLCRYAELPNCSVERNHGNIGYTRSVNRGIALCPGHDVVLLNSDTEVTPRWLETLRYVAYSGARVATVTPLSNNAGAFSAPEFGINNDLPGDVPRDFIARLVAGSGEGRSLDVPTGNGFCLYVRRKVLDEVGRFDETRFPRGYGEENDLCMRAFRAGWTHRVTDKVYVFHQRSQSFQSERETLIAEGAARVHAAYPEYRQLTQRFRDMEFSYVRHRIRLALGNLAPVAGAPAILFVISTRTGGTPQTNLDLMRALGDRYRCLQLATDGQSLELSALQGQSLVTRETIKLARAIEPISHRSDEYDRIVSDLLFRHGVELLHIRHIAWHGLGLAETAKSMGIPVVYSVHDFYAACPSLKLVDENLRHCGGRCTAGEGQCQVELWSPELFPPLKHRYVHRWREQFAEMLTHCDHLITTSPFARTLLRSVFPALEKPFSVIPHGRDFEYFERLATIPEPNEPLRILVLGNISLAKGAGIIREMLEQVEGGRFEFHFLGQVWTGLENLGIHHGTYEREKLLESVNEIAPHLGLVLSVWPETYCHTLTELWSLGIPALGIDLGSVGDRIRRSGAGWVVPADITARELIGRIDAVSKDRSDFESKLNALYSWQSNEGSTLTTKNMADEYHVVYRSSLNAYRTREILVGTGRVDGCGSNELETAISN